MWYPGMFGISEDLKLMNKKVPGELYNLNVFNGADTPLLDLAEKLLTEFPNETLYGCEMGIAYAGGVERIGKLWKDRGIIYGFDTFEDLHPRHLAKDGNSFEATCMDHWYTVWGVEKLQYDYIRSVLDEEGLSNVVLVKEEVHRLSTAMIPKLHYALMDMDLITSMKNGYEAIEPKLIVGGYLALHDVLPPTHLDGTIYDWFYNDIIKDYEIYLEKPESHLGIYKRIK